MVKKYEDKLRNVNTVPSDTNSLESYKKQLKELRAELERQQPQFDTLDTELSKARAVNERMIRSHSERDVDLERFREWVQQLLERWQGVHTQTETRARDLEQLGRQLHYYRDSYQRLMSWIEETKQRQEQLQSRTGGKGNHVSQQLLQQRVRDGVCPGCGWGKQGEVGSMVEGGLWRRWDPLRRLGLWRRVVSGGVGIR
uniref:Plectin-like n=1 Tax=Callorhinchus milii TaxID=7868 RepID=A0A4W3GSV8_CALMI